MTTSRRVHFEPLRAASSPAAVRATEEAVEHVRLTPRPVDEAAAA